MTARHRKPRPAWPLSLSLSSSSSKDQMGAGSVLFILSYNHLPETCPGDVWGDVFSLLISKVLRTFFASVKLANFILSPDWVVFICLGQEKLEQPIVKGNRALAARGTSPPTWQFSEKRARVEEAFWSCSLMHFTPPSFEASVTQKILAHHNFLLLL